MYWQSSDAKSLLNVFKMLKLKMIVISEKTWTDTVYLPKRSTSFVNFRLFRFSDSVN